MKQIRLIWELACKDLRLFVADRRGAALCFAVPIVLASAFGAIFHRPDGNAQVRVAALVVTRSGCLIEQRIVTALCASDKLSVSICDENSARRALAERRSTVVLILPDNLEHLTFLPGSQAHRPIVQVLHQPGHALEARLVEGLFTQVALQEAAKALLGSKAGSDSETLWRPFDIKRAAVPDVGTPALNAYAHSFCGMTLQYLLFWGMDSGLLLLRERRLGIWRRLRIAPVPQATLLAGKALAIALVALAQILFTFAFGRLVFGVTVNGSFAGFITLAVSAAFLSAATGLLVAGLGGTEGRARSIAIVVILSLSMLGGLWLPAFLLPDWMQRAGLALPTTWAVRGFEGVTWQAMPWPAALQCAGVLLGFSTSFLAIACYRLCRSEGVAR